MAWWCLFTWPSVRPAPGPVLPPLPPPAPVGTGNPCFLRRLRILSRSGPGTLCHSRGVSGLVGARVVRLRVGDRVGRERLSDVLEDLVGKIEAPLRHGEQRLVVS